MTPASGVPSLAASTWGALETLVVDILIAAGLTELDIKIKSRLELRKFTERLAALPLPEHLAAAINPLMTLLNELNRQISRRPTNSLSRWQSTTQWSSACVPLRVWAVVTALTFVATLDEAGRFGTAKQVARLPETGAEREEFWRAAALGADHQDRQRKAAGFAGGGWLVPVAL